MVTHTTRNKISENIRFFKYVGYEECLDCFCAPHIQLWVVLALMREELLNVFCLTYGDGYGDDKRAMRLATNFYHVLSATFANHVSRFWGL